MKQWLGEEILDLLMMPRTKNWQRLSEGWDGDGDYRTYGVRRGYLNLACVVCLKSWRETRR